MSSSRMILCDLCIVLLLGLGCVLAQETHVPPPDNGPTGNCTCGGFPTPSVKSGDEPLLSQTPGLVVKCDSEGENTCKNLCNALAIATKAKGPEVLCNKLVNAEELKLSAYFRICDHPWSYADLTAEEPLCCDDGKTKTCPSTEKNNGTDAADVKTVM